MTTHQFRMSDNISRGTPDDESSFHNIIQHPPLNQPYDGINWIEWEMRHGNVDIIYETTDDELDYHACDTEDEFEDVNVTDQHHVCVKRIYIIIIIIIIIIVIIIIIIIIIIISSSIFIIIIIIIISIIIIIIIIYAAVNISYCINSSFCFVIVCVKRITIVGCIIMPFVIVIFNGVFIRKYYGEYLVELHRFVNYSIIHVLVIII